MSQKHVESEKVKDARDTRARRLAEATVEWRRLADCGEYPLSLHEICLKALRHEYQLGAASPKRLVRR